MTYNTFLNGEFIDISQAKVSVFDRGFLFGDSVYEVIPIFNHATFGMQEHLERLDNSLRSIDMTPPLTSLNWCGIFKKLLDANEVDDGALYIQVTRGTYATRSHQVPSTIYPTILVTLIPIQQNKNQTLSATTIDDKRWLGCHTKATTLLPNILAKLHAEQEETDDAIFISDGYALEGTSSNLFIATKNNIVTPPLSQNILPGITRKLLLNALEENRLPHLEREITLKELTKADEIWLTSSTKDLAPVTQLNGKPVGSGKPGPMWHEANRVFQEFKLRTCAPSIENNLESLA